MLAEQNRMPNSSTEICIFARRTREGEMAGTVLHHRSGQWARFGSLLDLLAVYEKWMDAENFPQKTHAMRQFRKGGRTRDVDTQKKPMTGEEKPTFVVQVQYRQNASWQGTVSWLEGEKVAHFRSALELIRLMDEAVGQEDKASWSEMQQADEE